MKRGWGGGVQEEGDERRERGSSERDWITRETGEDKDSKQTEGGVLREIG